MFSDSEGVNLTDRIKMINRRFNHDTKEELKAEEQMVVAANQETTELEEENVEDVQRVVEVTEDKDDLAEKIEQLTAEIKKMNKHVLSIAKYIKKGK